MIVIKNAINDKLNLNQHSRTVVHIDRWIYESFSLLTLYTLFISSKFDSL